jgi:hypothetical protein
MPAMQVAAGVVVNGKIVVEGASLPEGAVVAVLSRGSAEGFTLSPHEEEELLESMAEIDRGEVASLEDLLASLPKA